MIKINPTHEQTIKQVCKLANPRASIQALANVLINAEKERTTLTAGDGTVEMTASIQAEVKTGGTFTVDAAKLSQALTACGFDAVVTIRADHIMIKSGKKKFKLTTLDADKYPSYETMDESIRVNVPLSDIKAVSITAATSDVRSYLNGVYIGNKLAASDGHRATCAEIEATETDIIIPIDSIKRAPDGGPSITTDGRTISFDYGYGVFKSRLIDGKFPNIDRVFGAVSKKITVNTDEFSDAIKTAMLTGGLVSIKSTAGNGIVSTISENNDETTAGFDCHGDDIDMNVNGKYLLDALSFYTGETDVWFNDNQIIIDGAFKSVVMCVRK